MSYYGSLAPIIPQRTWVEDYLIERKQLMLEEMKEMEIAIKRHITEAKREIIRELLNGENCKLIKDNIKEKINGSKIKRPEGNNVIGGKDIQSN